MTNTNLLEEIINKSGLKRAKIAEVLEITTQTLKAKITNRSEFTSTQIDKLCDLLKIDTAELRNKVFFCK